MTKSVSSSNISGTVRAIGSKSMAQRALAVASLAETPCTITGMPDSHDVTTAADIVQRMGARIDRTDESVRVYPREMEPQSTLYSGEAGLSVRMFSAIAALHDRPYTFTGGGSLTTRPLIMIEEALCQLGVECRTTNGFLPLHVTGPIVPQNITIDGTVSSQLLTGLLIALPCSTGDSEIEVKNLKSRPYVDMTIAILEDFGVSIEHHHYSRFTIQGQQVYTREQYSVEGDWSGAAFILVAGALAGEVTVTNLSFESCQGDRVIVDILKKCGAAVSMENNSIRVSGGSLEPFMCDASDCPDLFPPLVALAAGIEGTSVISGTNRLIHKESNRKKTLIEEFSAIGVDITEGDNTLVVNGGSVPGGTGSSHNDHRIAMALACSGLVSRNGVTIHGAESVNKSYPRFFEDLVEIGGDIT